MSTHVSGVMGDDVSTIEESRNEAACLPGKPPGMIDRNMRLQGGMGISPVYVCASVCVCV